MKLKSSLDNTNCFDDFKEDSLSVIDSIWELLRNCSSFSVNIFNGSNSAEEYKKYLLYLSKERKDFYVIELSNLLFACIDSGDISDDLLEDLIKLGADINNNITKFSCRESKLISLLETDDGEVEFSKVEQLVRLGCNVQCYKNKNERISALMLAVLINRPDIVELILNCSKKSCANEKKYKEYVDYSLPNSYPGATALHLAVCMSKRFFNLDIVKLLVEAGADVNAENYLGNSLHCALSNPSAVEFLLGEGVVDVGSKNPEGYTAYQLAEKHIQRDGDGNVVGGENYAESALLISSHIKRQSVILRSFEGNLNNKNRFFESHFNKFSQVVKELKKTYVAKP